MVVQTRLSLREYIAVTLRLFFSRPVFAFMPIGGLVIILAAIAQTSGAEIPIIDEKMPFFQKIMMGLFLLLFFPLTVVLSARKQFRADKRLQEAIVYEFTESHIIATGESFRIEMNWEKIYRIKEKGDWILIYQSPRQANIISKKDLGPQLQAFRALISSKGK